jgi:ATP-binding cassette subfamily B protein
MGFFAGINNEKYDRKYSDRELISRISGYFSAQSKRLVFASIIIVLIAFINAAMPVVISHTMDTLQIKLTPATILQVGLALTGVAFFSWGLNWVRRSLIVRAVGDVVMDIRTRTFRAAVGQDLSFFDQFSSGRIISRITTDTNDLGQLIVLVTDVVAQFFQALLISIILFQIEWKLSILLIGFLIFIFGIATIFRVMARRVTRHGMKAMANVNAAIKETISGILIAKNFRQEDGIFKSFDESNRQSYSVNVKRGFILSLILPTLNAMGGVFVGVLIYFGGFSAAQGQIGIGSWYLFIMSLDQFFFPVLSLTAFWPLVQSGLSAAERVFALIDAEPNVIQNEKRDVPRLKGSIHFDKLHFHYSDKEPVLTGFDLLIQPGETLALVGHTGAGKSSIARLIARFYEFQQGRLFLDGQDIRTLDLAQYRRQLGIIPQVPFLFSGTVADNIRYATPNIAEREILKLAHKIGDGEWLETLPNGLHTEVGERGHRLSMGQRQLVALMRVLAQNPAIFILDEATASIDPLTEWHIRQALNLILKESTSILIAHRLSTVKAADRIVVLSKGTIIEEGGHEELLQKKGHYAELYNTYFQHQSLTYVEHMKEMVAKQ